MGVWYRIAYSIPPVVVVRCTLYDSMMYDAMMYDAIMITQWSTPRDLMVRCKRSYEYMTVQYPDMSNGGLYKRVRGGDRVDAVRRERDRYTLPFI